MKKVILILLTLTPIVLHAENTKPNVVIIYGDDVGYGDVSCYGAELIQTPNIDKLASQGLRFTDGHCSAATCTPSRYSMLTGRHAFREDVAILGPTAPLCIPVDSYTIADMFKDQGYQTAVIGKWHLGIGQQNVKTDWNGVVKPGPLEIGFDYSFLLPNTNDRVPCVYLENHRVVNLDPKDPIKLFHHYIKFEDITNYPDGKTNRDAMTYYQSSHGHNQSVINGIGRIGYMAGGKSALWNDETMADEFVKQAEKYITAHKEKPFFLYFSSQDIHVPRTPHPRFKGKTDLGYRGDAMVQFDWSTGEIMRILEENGLTENTIVIFSSDNGPVYDDGYVDGTIVKTSQKEVDQGHDGSGIYRGGKYQIYEGGTRVPFIIRWPKVIKPGVSDALVNQIDFMASFAAYFKQELPAGSAADSRVMLDTFLGKSKAGLPFMVEEIRNQRAFREGNWKYIVANKPKKGKAKPGQLYNLKKDPGEQNNLIAKRQDIAQKLSNKLAAIEASDGIRLAKKEVEKNKKVNAYKTTANADGSEVILNLHIFNPADHQAGDKRPAVIFFFGGGWSGGKPEQFFPQAKHLSQKGMVAISAEYRVAGRNKTDPKFCLQDANSAIRYLRKNAASLGIDPDKIVSAGGSAGGHLAAMVGTEGELFNDPQDDLNISAKPQLSVQFNPVIDTSAEGYGHNRVSKYWEDFSPMLRLSKDTPPSLVMFGDNDELIPLSTIERYKLKAQEVESNVKVIIYPGKGHGFFNRGNSYTETVAEMDKFLTAHGFLNAE